MSPFLRIAAGVLLLWEPLNFAAVTLEVWPTLAFRGWIAAVELVAHGIIAALCVAAGMMVLNHAPDGRLIARIAVVLSVGRVVYTLYWSALPKQTAPGAEPAFAAIAVGVGAIVLLMLMGPSTPPSR
jgi:hypothetical protein